ncbi:Parathymosin, partial [Ophiophagus hannah]
PLPPRSLVTEPLFLALPCRGREGFCSWRLGAERQQLAGPCFEAASRLPRLILAAARMSEKSADEAPVELGAKELKEKKEKHEEKSARKDKKEIVEDDENGAEEEEDDEDANPEDVDDEDEEDEDDENEREPDTHAVKRSAEKKQEESWTHCVHSWVPRMKLIRKERRQKMALQLDPLGSICILFSAVQLSAHLHSSVCAGSLRSAVAADEEEEEFNVLSVKRKLKEALLQLQDLFPYYSALYSFITLHPPFR